jgi:hypothetical protein
MAGQSAARSTADALADERATRMPGHNNDGVSGTSVSEIGGAGRKGASGHGTLDGLDYTRIDGEVVHNAMNGIAEGGQMGVDSGFGRTFKGGAPRRKED